MKQCLSKPEQCKPVTRNFLRNSDDGWCKNNCIHGNLPICERNCKCAEKGKQIMLDIRLFGSFIKESYSTRLYSIFCFAFCLEKECCGRILVSSSSYAKETYPSAMGAYVKINNSHYNEYTRRSRQGSDQYHLSPTSTGGWQVSKYYLWRCRDT